MALPLQAELRQAARFWRPLLTVLLLSNGILLALCLRGGYDPAPRLLSNQPGNNHYHEVCLRQFAAAQTRIWIMLYVIHDPLNAESPVHGLLQSLRSAHQRGVDVRLFLQATDPDNDFDPRHDTLIAWCAEHGIPVQLDASGRRNHSKMLLIDDRAIVGSHNWSRSALTRNYEYSLMTHAPETIARVHDAFTAFGKDAAR